MSSQISGDCHVGVGTETAVFSIRLMCRITLCASLYTVFPKPFYSNGCVDLIVVGRPKAGPYRRTESLNDHPDNGPWELIKRNV